MARYTELSLGETLKGLVENPAMIALFGPMLTGDKEHIIMRALGAFSEMADVSVEQCCSYIGFKRYFDILQE